MVNVDALKKKIDYSFEITILVHIYYPHSYESLRFQLENFKAHKSIFVFSIAESFVKKQNLMELIHKDFQNNYEITTISNRGKDVGGKLSLIDLYNTQKILSKYLIFLHDKKSPHTIIGDTWREKLFRIIEPAYTDQILHIFESKPKVGIICAKEFISNEYNSKTGNFDCTSNQISKDLIKKYELNLSNYDFVGGTMFWVRSEIIHKFFSKHSPLAIRATLEPGNVLDHENGTHTHAWERMLSWIAIDQGYEIVGI